MINLIPNQEKKEMIRNFYYRLGTIFFFSIALVMLVGAIALLPSYVLSSMKKNLNNEKLESVKAEPTYLADQETEKEISGLDAKLTLLEKAQGRKFIVSERIINEVLSKKIPDVKITQISFEEDKAAAKKVSIRGTARSREGLLLFRRALEDDPSFKMVDLPISNFVKGTNIQFNVTLIAS